MPGLHGRVTGVEFDPATENVLVAIRIAAEHKLYTNAMIALDRPLLGSQSTINISGIGTPDKGLLKEGDTILGGLAPPAPRPCPGRFRPPAPNTVRMRQPPVAPASKSPRPSGPSSLPIPSWPSASPSLRPVNNRAP